LSAEHVVEILVAGRRLLKDETEIITPRNFDGVAHDFCE
jgi:hypothetical protein